jgi:hypothetical protein
MRKDEAEHLLEHWIEHNEAHSKSFRDRAQQVKELSAKAAEDMEEAAKLMDKCTQMLKKAKEDL